MSKTQRHFEAAARILSYSLSRTCCIEYFSYLKPIFNYHIEILTSGDYGLAMESLSQSRRLVKSIKMKVIIIN